MTHSSGLALDFLGPGQWAWLESQLSQSDARVNVIVNGLQVNAGNRIPNGNVAEDWEKFPLAKKRLYDAILSSGARAPILVSGDVHMAQITRVDCSDGSGGSLRSLMEITTSGITHRCARGRLSLLVSSGDEREL